VTTPRTPITADLTASEADERPNLAEAWLPNPTRDEFESADRAREPRPLQDYFERMRERGLLD
jgi:hypothetical protein